MIIGYARVSNKAQSGQYQIDALLKADCDLIFFDKGVSGASDIKPQLVAALAKARNGIDTIIVCNIDRLGRSTRHVIDIVEEMQKRKIAFRSLAESNIDTSSASGNLNLQFHSIIAEYERKLASERSKAGLEAARISGKRIGRPQTITDRDWVEVLKLLQATPPHTVSTVASHFKVSRQAIYRRLKADLIKDDANVSVYTIPQTTLSLLQDEHANSHDQHKVDMPDSSWKRALRDALTWLKLA